MLSPLTCRVPILATTLGFVLALPGALPADGPYRSRDSRDPNDLSEGTYPIPYQKPTVPEITEVLERILGYLEGTSPTQVVDERTGAVITDFSVPNVDARIPDGAGEAFYPLDYTMGVIHSGLLLAGEVTGDARFANYTRRQLQFIADRLPYFRAVVRSGARPGKGTFGAILDTGSLDDSGSMCAALVKARRRGIGPDLREVIDHWSGYIAHEQFRIADGTLARRRPQPESLWTDDLYMSVPALAQMGALTGDRAWFDDAVKQVLQFHGHLWDPQAGLYAHGKHLDQPLNPEFYWARANGWAMLASVELLDVLPADHPGRERVLENLRAHVRSVAKLQSGAGLWHQMLDRTDSYLETSASAIFVYSIARAIDAGWISPVAYGSVAQAGWMALTTRVNARGQVEGTCVGTTLASDHVYYYNRPQSVYATHGYGPVLLAGAEMIRLLQNPAIDVQYRLRTYHYVPRLEPKR
ncbi:MAG TPA: glycoside hydrolase family 88 protein [Vicinamibacteria bacterium]|nr:glycoside hydrolase family 88 protein [Vicinamibacteria bacterium]